ncbi:MAG: glycosyltransferase family 4 protein [Clostridiales bacterium]|nr:glycosyltransferase family 4 protein [Clostridiales bacterium]
MAKICILTALLFTPGGEQRVTTVIANELAKNNQLIIYTMDEEENRADSPYHLDPGIEIRYTKQPVYGFVNRCARRLIRDINEKTNILYQSKWAYKWLEFAYFQKSWQEQTLKELTKEPYDVILAVSGGNTLQLGLIADKLSCKTIGWEHNAFEAYFKIPGMYFYHQDQLFQRALKNLDSCVVLNEHISKQYQEAFGKTCEVIYNPRSFVSEEKSSLSKKTFVSCGRMIKQKGYDLLIDAFYDFSKENQEWNLVIVGDGEDRGMVEEKIAEYGLTDRVTITGYTGDVKKYLLNASAYVMSSRWEGFPMVLTEAFEMGLPTVAFDISAVEPLLTEGKQGFLAKSYDTKDFAKQMLRMADATQEMRREMAKNAILKARSLSVENIIKEWKQLLQAE